MVVWRGEYLPFGEVFTEDKDPDGDGVEVEQPFRFPGQYHDQETGLYYNYFRDYDPQLGRYVEADPIGLAGGVNVYGYVDIVGKPSIQTNLYLYSSADPVNLVDPLGLAPIPGAEEDVDYILDWPGGTMGSSDFMWNYIYMRWANTIGADKYFHCLANCQSSRRGRGGRDVAVLISETREFIDLNIGGDPPEACAEDRAANELGRMGDPTKSCQDVCAPKRPKALSGNF